MNSQSKETQDLIQYIKDDNINEIESLMDNSLFSGDDFFKDINGDYLHDKIRDIENQSSYFVLSMFYSEYKLELGKSIYYMMKSDHSFKDSFVSGILNDDEFDMDDSVFNAQNIIYKLAESKINLEKENEQLKEQNNNMTKYIRHLETMPDGPEYREAKKRFTTQDYQL